MQIKFLNIYDHYTEPLQVQYELLGFWQKSIVNDQVNFIHKAGVEFNTYTFAEYPDQERLNNEIRKSVISGYDSDLKTHFWLLNNKRYTSFEDLYNMLAESRQLMELTITVEALV
jgi:hypothetical protein